MRKTWIWVSAAALTVVCVGAVLAARPVARSVITSKAAARGLVLEVEGLKLGWLSAELTGVALALDGVSAISAKLDRVDVALTLGGSLKRVVVKGGSIQMQGSVEELRDQLESWRARRPSVPQKDPSPEKSSRVEVIHDLNLTWRNAFTGAGEQKVSGLQVERTGEGLRAGANLIELDLGQVSAQVAGASMKTSAQELKKGHIQELGAAEMRLGWAANEDPARAPASPTPRVSPDLKKDPPLARMLQAHPQRVIQLQAALQLFRTKILPKLPDDARVDRLWLTYGSQRERLEIGPNRLTAKNNLDSWQVELAPRKQTRGTPLAFKLQVPRTTPAQDEAALSVSVKGGPVSLSTLGMKDGPFGLQGVDRAYVEGELEGRLSADSKQLTMHGSAALEGLSIDSRSLSDSIVVFPKMRVTGNGLVATDGTKLLAQDMQLSMGETRFLGGLHLERSGDAVLVKAQAQAPLVSCQALLDSAPRGLLGPVEGMHFRGTFSLKSGIDLNTSELSKMRVQWDFENGCKATAVPRVLDPDQFRELFRREVAGAGGIPMQAEFGPHSTNWAGIDEVSPYVQSALLVTEDGRFFRHHGFDDRAIESAIFDNTVAGGFVRGASTISMQLAKNLYLSRDKTLSRKLQEAALTSLLEQSFDKRELLELYVNVVEFGPGIYGVKNAAEYYFNSQPRDLSATQAFFLASVLPNPNRPFFQENGRLKEGTLRHVRHLLEISHKRGALSDEELQMALSEEPIFGQPLPAMPPKAPEQGEHDGEASVELENAPPEPSDATITRDERQRPARASRPKRGLEL